MGLGTRQTGQVLILKISSSFNTSNTKINLTSFKIQFVPRSKHNPTWL